MDRIDFHIHTVATASDSKNFDFDLNALMEYVEKARLSAIAITNHNAFYRDNYNQIVERLNIPVFPGAELNVTTAGSFGHVLIIANPDEINDFADGMATFAAECPGAKDHATWERISQIFPNLKNWLVIPHYRKTRQLDSVTIAKIGSLTGYDALEVANAKKWLIEASQVEKPVVVFSDCRPGMRMPDDDPDDDIRRYAYGYTYLQCADMTFNAIKSALSNPRNVEVFDCNRDFEILPEALPASRRMNVILGERSSGKTFTLKRILDAYDENDRLYIEQFEITNKAKKDIFDKDIENEDNEFFDVYFRPLQDSINQYYREDFEVLEDAVRAYCAALIRFAEAPTDEYSDRPIYRSEEFNYIEDDALEQVDINLRHAVRTLLNGGKRHDVVMEHLDPQSLINLEAQLRALMKSARLSRWQRAKCDEVVAAIKAELSKQSSRKPLPSVEPIRDFFKLCYREKRLAKTLDSLKEPVELKTVEEYKYLKKRTRLMQTNAREARKACKATIPPGTNIAGLFGDGITAENRLSILRSFDPTVQAEACRLLFAIKGRIVLNDGSNATLSGGQRAEYLLLHRISNSAGKDVVLIDEPESSFDNPFLNSDVINLLNDVAERSTVFLVTHNNTLGVSLLPDRIIYTEKTPDGEYRVYSGELSSTMLVDVLGNECNREEKLLSTMEAGRHAYLERRIHYGLA